MPSVSMQADKNGARSTTCLNDILQAHDGMIGMTMGWEMRISNKEVILTLW